MLSQRLLDLPQRVDDRPAAVPGLRGRDLVHQCIDVLEFLQCRPAGIVAAPARLRLQPDGERLGEVLRRMALRIPVPEVQYVAPAAGTRRISVGVGCRRTAEYAPPAGPAPEPVGIVDRMAGLVTHDAVTPFPVAAFHLAHHLPLQLKQARVREIEGHGEAGDAVRRKPLGRQPHARPESQAAPFELPVQPLDVEPQRATSKTQPEAAESEVQE